MKFDRKKFFDGFRAEIDETIEQEQVDGLEFLLTKMEADPFWKDLRQIAYALATAGHETAWSFQPVEEGYYLGSKAKAFQKTLRYYPYYGRGYVQLTWKKNYEKAGKVLGLDLVNKPELALDREGAYLTMTYGMHQGWFTGKKLSDYISDAGKDYKNARKIINGLDKANLIAGYAKKFEDILRDSKVSAAAVVNHANSVNPTVPASDPPNEQPPTPEVKTTEVATTATTTTAVETTVPAGDPPDADPTKVTKNSLSSQLLAGVGGVGGLATAAWGFVTGNLNTISVGIVCVTVIILVVLDRWKQTDVARMYIASDPSKKNTT